MQSSTDKNGIRIQVLAQRQRVSAEDALQASQKVADFLIEIIPAGAVVAGYCAVRGELDLCMSMNRLSTAGIGLCLPVIEAADKPLFFRHWAPDEPLEKGLYGIDTPLANAPIVKPDVLLVPLVAFDQLGNRLGYGAGYYDRTIKGLRQNAKKLHVIGIGYSLQKMEPIQAESHDQKMDMMVTEKRVIPII
jgi:5-formyltetrahydrofolate cyclo-ligase